MRRSKITAFLCVALVHSLNAACTQESPDMESGSADTAAPLVT